MLATYEDVYLRECLVSTPDLLEVGPLVYSVYLGSWRMCDTFCKHLLTECKNEYLDEISKNLI